MKTGFLLCKGGGRGGGGGCVCKRFAAHKIDHTVIKYFLNFVKLWLFGEIPVIFMIA